MVVTGVMITTKSIINRFCKLASFNLIKLRSINVKKVIIPKNRVIEKIKMEVKEKVMVNLKNI